MSPYRHSAEVAGTSQTDQILGERELCDATNESSVRDMLCRDNKEVGKHCR
jgi:hypothetical protein